MIYAVSCTKSSGLFFGADLGKIFGVDLGKTAPKSAEKWPDSFLS